MANDIGPTLREARMRREIDLDEVEAQTKIRVRYLSALEDEEWDVLPDGPYARSFIRTYASFLGLDGERLPPGLCPESEALDQERPAPAEPIVRTGAPLSAPRRRINPLVAGLLIAAALVAVLLVLG